MNLADKLIYDECVIVHRDETHGVVIVWNQSRTFQLWHRYGDNIEDWEMEVEFMKVESSMTFEEAKYFAKKWYEDHPVIR